ncbi:MAG: agmatinase family protein [Cyclobacteriaceae bacterium]
MYNPSAVGKIGSLFGLPYSQEESDLIIIPVELDVTTSYVAGTSFAPNLILQESAQLDLSLLAIEKPWELKMALGDSLSKTKHNEKYRTIAEKIIARLENGDEAGEVSNQLHSVNHFCEEVQDELTDTSAELIDKNKLVAVLGGDHSSPFGLIKALSRIHEFGILQIDAHMDLRNAYEGFHHSHASIMYNALQLTNVKTLTQVGIRDYCEEEELYMENSARSVHTFFDESLFKKRLRGKGWTVQTEEIIETLPQKVYISFDIDGLDPAHCPHTGTPVPGGLSFNEAVFLIEMVVRSGREIIGFDLCEVGNSAWDANVGARVLYRLATAMGVSKKLLQFKKS